MRRLDRLIVVVVLLAGLAELVLPGAAAQVVARRAVEIVKKATGITFAPVKSATVRSFPAVSMLLGSVDRIVVDFGPVKMSGISIDVVRVDVRDLRFAPASLAATTGLKVQSQGEVAIEMVITQESLNRDLASLGIPLAVPNVSLDDGRVRIGGQMRLLGTLYDVGFQGRIILVSSEPRKVFFVPDELDVNGQAAPPMLGNMLKTLLGQSITLVDMEAQRIPLVFRQVDVGSGRVTVTATVMR